MWKPNECSTGSKNVDEYLPRPSDILAYVPYQIARAAEFLDDGFGEVATIASDSDGISSLLIGLPSGLVSVLAGIVNISSHLVGYVLKKPLAELENLIGGERGEANRFERFYSNLLFP